MGFHLASWPLSSRILQPSFLAVAPPRLGAFERAVKALVEPLQELYGALPTTPLKPRPRGFFCRYLLTTAVKREPTSDPASSALRCLEGAWVKLSSIHLDLPPAVLLILPARRRGSPLGHFAHSRWRYQARGRMHEVAVSPVLFGAPRDLLATLLHEAAHAILFEKEGEAGCTGSYYHRIEFRDAARKLGLACEFRNTRYGWCNTSWPTGGVPSRYSEVLEVLGRLPLGLTDKRPLAASPPPAGRLPRWGLRKLACRCPRFIYAPRSVSSSGEIICHICRAAFEAP